MAAERYQQGSPLVSQCVRSCIELTPHDDNELVYITAGIRVNVSGLVKMMFDRDNVAVTLQLIAGVNYEYQVRRVYSTGTDAAVVTGKIHGLY